MDFTNRSSNLNYLMIMLSINKEQMPELNKTQSKIAVRYLERKAMDHGILDVGEIL